MIETRLTLFTDYAGVSISHEALNPTDIDSFELCLPAPTYTKVTVPILRAAQDRLTEEIKKACGKPSCGASCKFELGKDERLFIATGALAVCSADDCPMVEARQGTEI